MKHKIIVLCTIIFLLPITAFSYEWVWQNPLPQGNPLKSVWTSSGSDVFAVGYNGIILHYDGNTWKLMESGTKIWFSSVWGSSATDVFAAGSAAVVVPESSCQNIINPNGGIYHYDGSNWTPMAGAPSNAGWGLWGSSATDVFAVGGGIYHYNGIDWTCMETGIGKVFWDVWGSSATDVFAVGSDSLSGGSIILHYNGTTWSAMTVQNAPGHFTGVWGSSSTDVFAVSVSGIIYHYDGTNWTLMDSGTTADFKGIWGKSSSDVFVVGDKMGANKVILHYDGNNWSPMLSELGENTYGLQGVWGNSSTDVFAVGEYGAILHYDGITWSYMSSGPCAAEAIYGENSEQTELLRKYRDNVLSKTSEGQEIIKTYYKFSPTVTKLLEHRPLLKNRAKAFIDNMLPGIRKKVEESNKEP